MKGIDELKNQVKAAKKILLTKEKQRKLEERRSSLKQ